ncbi:GPI ethanolamine phosphate transferase 2 isoform X2 [Hetaerina americana]
MREGDMASMWLLWTLTVALIGQVLFIYGFLPISIAGLKVTEDRPLPTSINGLRVNSDSLYRPIINKLILVVIDAMRDDFIIGPDAARHMPYLSSLIYNGRGVHFTSLVEPPTVTLPRIKAMTMGTIPNYVDVILNVIEKESNCSKENSFIGRAAAKRLNTVFYGDDTWLRLFPNSFLRFEGTSSFYVSDFNEVDNNVTRHLDHELQQDDWDVMILHYLGLDHIGHVHGPYSKLIPQKLQEMDDVIKKLFLGLKKKHHSSLLVICGDHGMKDTGGHGGATYSETHVPLLFVSPLSLDFKSHCLDLNIKDRIVNQRDLASTLSVLLGLQPPSMNLGAAIPCILRIFIPETDAYLYALHVNAWQVASLLESVHDSFKDGSYLFEEASKLHSEWIKWERDRVKYKPKMKSIGNQDELIKKIAKKYAVGITQMTSKLGESVVNFDYYAMFLGVVITWQAFMLSMLKEEVIILEYRWTKSFLLAVIMMVFHFSICFFGSSFISNSSLSRHDSFTLSTVFVLIFIVAFNAHELFCGSHLFKLSHVKEKLKVGSSPENNFLTFGTFLHIVSLFSSSFIEEEHQTWQFLFISLIILLGVKICCSIPRKDKNHMPTEEPIHFIGSVPYICNYRYQDQEPHPKPIMGEGIFTYQKKELLKFTSILLIHRFLRNYNHTGDKWGNLPDIGDWISDSENIMIRSVVMAMSLLGITFFLVKNSPIKGSNGLFIVFAALNIYAYRAAIGDVSAFDMYPSSRGSTEFFILLILMVLIMANGVYEAFKVLIHDNDKKKQNFNEGKRKYRTLEQDSSAAFVILTHEICKFWIILCSSLNRPGDVPVIFAFLFCSHTLANSVMKTGRCDVNTMPKTFIWLGMVFYFFKGNSNSLASLDLKAAYTGQNNYSVVIVGILLFCHTFSMPILALLLLFHYLAVTTSRSNNFDLRCPQKIMNAAVKSVIMTRLFPVVFYLPFIILQRHHLFIWTVFAPKLLYEAFLTLSSLFGLFLVIGLQRCLSHLAKLQRYGLIQV